MSEPRESEIDEHTFTPSIQQFANFANYVKSIEAHNFALVSEQRID